MQKLRRSGLLAAALFALGSSAAGAADPAVHASLAADLDGDGKTELAVALGGPEVTLVILAPTPPHDALSVVASGTGIAWTQAGEDARLDQDPATGSLRLTTSNYGIGRNKWEQVLTIAWRDGAWRIAGLDHSGFDTLTAEGADTCSANLLTGRVIIDAPDGTRSERRLTGPAPTLARWQADRVGEICDW